MDRKELDDLIARSKAAVAAMSPEQLAEVLRQQRESYVRAEMSWPEPKFRWVDGTKVYDSYEDYCCD